MSKKIFNFKQYIVNEKKLDNSCPVATRNLEVNTKNRDNAISAPHIKYGPLNLNDEEYWEKYAEKWGTTADVAKKSNCSNCVAFDISPSMKECMPGSVDKEGYLGYCWMHHFKCHSARTCNTWATGGPIDDDETSKSWADKAPKETLGLNEKKKLKFHHSDAPDAEGRFRDLGIRALAKWLIRTRKGDMRKITGSLNQQINFNKKSDPKYAKKMEKVREEVKRILNKKKKDKK